MSQDTTQKKIIVKKKKCPVCGKLKPHEEVYYRINPYQSEINGIEDEELMCNDCEHECAMDI
jgi:C4-type Zn-finger protein